MNERSLPQLILLSLLWCQSVIAGDEAKTPAATLPEPLSLAAALASIDDNHPRLVGAQAGTASREADAAQAAASDDARIDLTAELHRVDPIAGPPYDGRDDSRASITLYKRLYDFGRTRHRIDAAAKEIAASRARLTLTRLQLRQKVMQDYFNVLLADLAAATANEAMSVAYVRLDRARDELELGRIPELELLQLEDAYQERLLERQRAESAQRQTRAQLALTLNRPDELSATLEPPELPGLTSPLPEYEDLLNDSLANNPALQALNAQLLALQDEQKAVRAQRYPELYLQLEAHEYRQEYGSRTPLRGILGINVPLYQGGRVDADISAQVAKRHSLTARKTQTEYEIRQKLLTTLQQIATLQLQLKQATIREDYRELYLDRSRAEYELEIKTDLGDAMVEQSDARQFAEKTRFELALARETLVVLTGNPSWSALTPPDAAAANEAKQ